MYYNIKWFVICIEQGGAAVQDETKRISVRIAGRRLSLITEEEESFVRDVEAELNRRLEESGQGRLKTREHETERLILCAADAISRELQCRKETEKAQTRMNALEAECADLRAEYARLSDRLSARLSGRLSDRRPARGGGLLSDGEEPARETDGVSAREKLTRAVELLRRMKENRTRERGEGS